MRMTRREAGAQTGAAGSSATLPVRVPTWGPASCGHGSQDVGEQSTEITGLRVLAADEDERALQGTVAILRELGHVVTALAIGTAEAAEVIARDDPDASVVVVHDDDEHALDLIDEIAAFSSGPVIALLDGEDPEFVRSAAARGIFAYARPSTAAAVQGALEVAMRRHREHAKLSQAVDQLEGALERRAIIERAKGILMERHSVDDRAAFELLRAQARSTSSPVVELARAVAGGHALLPRHEK